MKRKNILFYNFQCLTGGHKVNIFFYVPHGTLNFLGYFLGQTQQLSIFTKSNILWFRRKKGINLNHYRSMITAHIHFQNEKKRHKVNLVVLLWKMAQNCIFWPNSKWKWCLMTQICINIEGEQFLMPSSNDYR